jgi:geranylgeranyl reductase family protein
MIRDVVIVGGGPAGAATAIHLARAGLDVCVLDRARFPRDKACGEFLSPAATPLLENLGVRDAIDAAGARRLDQVRIFGGSQRLDLAFPSDADAPPWGYALSRRKLDAILLDTAASAGAEVREGVGVDHLILDRGRVAGVTTRDANGERGSLRSRLVVGAGGRNCPVARALGLQRRSPRRRIDLLAHWSADGHAMGTECELHVDRSGYVAAAPVEGGRLNINCVVPQTTLQRSPDPTLVYSDMLRRHPSLARWVVGEPAEPVVATDITPLTAARATADGALLVGDSALFLDPFTGQGIYLALASAGLAAGVAARALSAGSVDRTILAEYDRSRATEFRAKRRVSVAIQHIIDRPWLTRRVVRALRRNRELADTLAAVTGDMVPADRAWQLDFGYHLAQAAI